MDWFLYDRDLHYERVKPGWAPCMAATGNIEFLIWRLNLLSYAPKMFQVTDLFLKPTYFPKLYLFEVFLNLCWHQRSHMIYRFWDLGIPNCLPYWISSNSIIFCNTCIKHFFLAFTCSKSTMQTSELCVKSIQS